MITLSLHEQLKQHKADLKQVNQRRSVILDEIYRIKRQIIDQKIAERFGDRLVKGVEVLVYVHWLDEWHNGIVRDVCDVSGNRIVITPVGHDGTACWVEIKTNKLHWIKLK